MLNVKRNSRDTDFLGILSRNPIWNTKTREGQKHTPGNTLKRYLGGTSIPS